MALIPEEQSKLLETETETATRLLVIAYQMESLEPACMRRLTGGNVALNFLPHEPTSAPPTDVLVLQTYVRREGQLLKGSASKVLSESFVSPCNETGSMLSDVCLRRL